jgi:hypothetical protein
MKKDIIETILNEGISEHGEKKIADDFDMLKDKRVLPSLKMTEDGKVYYSIDLSVFEDDKFDIGELYSLLMNGWERKENELVIYI